MNSRFLEGSKRQLKAIPTIILAILVWEGFCWIYESAKPTTVNHIVIINESDQPIDAKIVNDAGTVIWQQEGILTYEDATTFTVINYPFPFNREALTVKSGDQIHRTILQSRGRYGKTLVITIYNDHQVRQFFDYLPNEDNELL